MTYLRLALDHTLKVAWPDCIDDVDEERPRGRLSFPEIVAKVDRDLWVISDHIDKPGDLQLWVERKCNPSDFLQLKRALLPSEQLSDKVLVDLRVRVKIALFYNGV